MTWPKSTCIFPKKDSISREEFVSMSSVAAAHQLPWQASDAAELAIT